MTDGQLDARTQRCEELSGKGKALSNVQADAVDAGPRRVARKPGVAATWQLVINSGTTIDSSTASMGFDQFRQ
jgi:hypothetical protein